MKFFFYYILYNLSFLMTTLEKISGAATTCESKFIQITFFILSFFFSPNKIVFHSSTFSTQTKYNEEKLIPPLSPPNITWGELCSLFQYYKKAPQPFCSKIQRIYFKKVIQEKFLTLKSILKLKFIGYDLFQSKAF